MVQPPIRFEDGEAYERSMGVWSQLAGETFIEWLDPAPGLIWADIGCGTGAFSELLLAHCAPSAVHGVDPSEEQLHFARSRPATRRVEFRRGDAMALPYQDNSIDAAVMALVLFFVPDSAQGVAEMRRVVKPGGSVSAYLWDIAGGGFPFEPVQAEMRAMGMTPARAPRLEVSREDVLLGLWNGAGLIAIETRKIIVRRSFRDFDDFWRQTTASASLSAAIAEMPPDDAVELRARVQARLLADDSGRVSYEAWATAVKGRRSI